MVQLTGQILRRICHDGGPQFASTRASGKIGGQVREFRETEVGRPRANARQLRRQPIRTPGREDEQLRILRPRRAGYGDGWAGLTDTLEHDVRVDAAEAEAGNSGDTRRLCRPRLTVEDGSNGTIDFPKHRMRDGAADMRGQAPGRKRADRFD
jgi:hypothetical protein